ncbi:MAG: class I SAM-dependent methyltransferase [Candidatus Altiarchaeota archaeon]
MSKHEDPDEANRRRPHIPKPPKQPFREVEYGHLERGSGGGRGGDPGGIPMVIHPQMVCSTVDWKSVPPAEIEARLRARAGELFAGSTGSLNPAANTVIGALASSGGQLDWQYGQIIENWMVFVNFAARTGLTGADALIKLNDVSFTERAKHYSAEHGPDSMANRRSVDAMVVEALRTVAGSAGGRIGVHDAGCADAERTVGIMTRLRDSGVDCWFSGSDISPAMVKAARGKGLEEVVEANLLKGIPAGRKVNAVICLDDTIGHVPGRENRLQVMANFAGILVEGGFILLNVNNSGGFFTPRTRKNDEVRARFIEALPPEHRGILGGTSPGEHLYTVGGPGPVCYLHHFSEDELKSLGEDSGCRIVPVMVEGAGKSEAREVNTASLHFDGPGKGVRPGTINDGYDNASMTALFRLAV